MRKQGQRYIYICIPSLCPSRTFYHVEWYFMNEGVVPMQMPFHIIQLNEYINVRNILILLLISK